MELQAGTSEDGWAHGDRWRLSYLHPRIGQILDSGKHYHAPKQALGDVSIELEKWIERKLIEAVIELMA